MSAHRVLAAALPDHAAARPGNDPIFALNAEANRRAAAGESILNSTLGALMTDDGRLATSRTERGDRVIDGADLAAFLESAAGQVEIPAIGASSARNRFTGIVTKVTSDDIVAKVELAAGPYRLVSILTSEAAEELKLAPGVLAVASVKSTDVVISLPAAP